VKGVGKGAGRSFRNRVLSRGKTTEKGYLMRAFGSPLKVIREKCLDCSCGNSAEVRDCAVHSCALWPFRMGRNPNRAGLGPKHPTFRPRG
jgi:hypothetical protein